MSLYLSHFLSTITFAIVHLAVHDEFWNLVIAHSEDMTSPTQLTLHQKCVDDSNSAAFRKRSAFEMLSLSLPPKIE